MTTDEQQTLTDAIDILKLRESTAWTRGRIVQFQLALADHGHGECPAAADGRPCMALAGARSVLAGKS